MNRLPSASAAQKPGLFASWVNFWFAPSDPIGLHILRVLAGLLFLFWLLPFAGSYAAFFGREGWFDARAYSEASQLPKEMLPPHLFGWSLYLLSDNPFLPTAVYWGSIAVLVLFTLGVATRLTGLLTWVVVVSHTANPALAYDADPLLVMLAFYLMVGYLLLRQRDASQSLVTRLLGPSPLGLFDPQIWTEKPRPRSVGANLALRLFQINFAIAMVASALHKLQVKEWWNGQVPWFYLNRPFQTTPEQVQAYKIGAEDYLIYFSLATYLALAWQLFFPLFAWRRSLRFILLGGGVLSWIAYSFFLPLPLIGPIFMIGCLGFLTPAEWLSVLHLLGRLPGIQQLRDRLARAPAEGMTPPKSGTEPKVSLASAGTAIMKTKHLIVLLIGTALAAVGLTCAPVDPDAGKDPKPAEEPVVAPGVPVVLPNAGLKVRIEAAIDQVRSRDLDTTNGFWVVFHGILGLGPSVTLLDRSTGKRYNALDYIAGGGEIRGLRFIPGPQGLDVYTGPGTFISQGHQDQFVAEMVQWGVKKDKPFLVAGKPYVFEDFLRFSKARASAKTPQELEWAIVIIGDTYGTDITWTNATGEEVRFEDLLRKELDKSLAPPTACGGTHRLFGLTWVYHLHLQKGGRTEGIWKEIAERIATYKKLARDTQNLDGTFSTSYFDAPGNAPDVQVRIGTTGHIFEWLSLALTDEELKEPWVQQAASALSLMFLENRTNAIEGGAMYHAVHGLLMYYSRVYGSEWLKRKGQQEDPEPHMALLPEEKVRPTVSVTRAR